MAQPKMGVVRWMLGRTFYPDNEYTRDADGNPIRPYDMATDVMAEFMGVAVAPTDEKVAASLAKVTMAAAPEGKVAAGDGPFEFSGKLNDSWRVANLLWKGNATISRLDNGNYVVTGARRDAVVAAARATGVDFTAASGTGREIKQPRIAMYQRFNGGNADEGWTRLLFEQFDQPYHTIFDPELKAGSLNAKYDVVILPADNPGTLTGPATPIVASAATATNPAYTYDPQPFGL
jgi:hypothetical protein